jgi:hypothetical protein
MRDESEGFAKQVVDRLGFGDQIVLIQMQQTGLSDHPLRWARTMPQPRDASYVTDEDRKQLDGAKRGVITAIPSFFSLTGNGKAEHTDIFATMRIASEFEQNAPNLPHELILLSDMLQSAQGFEMERLAKMPPANWVTQQKATGLLPTLYGACVVVVGVDPTNAQGIAVRNFWQSYFAASGASLDLRDYRATPPSREMMTCN